MRTVASIEQQAQQYEKLAADFASTIELIRAEPAWQPGAPLSESSHATKMEHERNFHQFTDRSEEMRGDLARFRRHAQLLGVIEVMEEDQEALEGMHDELRSLIWLIRELNADALGLLNSLRHQRGAELYERIPPEAN